MQDDKQVNGGSDDSQSAGRDEHGPIAEVAETIIDSDHGSNGGQVVRRLTIGRVEGDLRIKGRSALGFEIEPAAGEDDAPTVVWDGADVTVDSPVGCEISIPGSASLYIHEVEGALRIKGVAGDVMIGVVGRELSLKNVGPTRIETVGERLKVRGIAGGLEASTVGGSADVESVAGNVRLETVGGSLDLAHVHGDVGANVGGSARIDRSLDGDSALRITAGGSIECSVPEDVAADIRAAAGGVVRIDLPEIDIVGGVQHYAGSVGGGGKPIELTAGGSIRIHGATEGPPRVAFERGADHGRSDQRHGRTHDHGHDHINDHVDDFVHDHRHDHARARVHARVHDAAHAAWDMGPEWNARASDFEKDVSRLVRDAAGRLDGLAVEINASVAEALSSLPGALESAGLNEEHAARLASRLQRIGERATERAERQIKRAMHRAEREVGRVGRRAGEVSALKAVHLRKAIKVRTASGATDEGSTRVRAGQPPRPAATGDEVRSVLRMLESGSITADEAERLLSALERQA